MVNQLEGEMNDIAFVSQQKDRKIEQLERTVSEMRQKLSQALQSTQHKNSTEIQKIFGNQRNGEELQSQFQMSAQLDAGSAPASAHEDFKKQQEIWAQELRRSDERAQKFKEEIDELLVTKRQLTQQATQLNEKIAVREQEIQRLHSTYKGGQTVDALKNAYGSSNIQGEHEQMTAQMIEIGRIVGTDFSPNTGENVVATVIKVVAQL